MAEVLTEEDVRPGKGGHQPFVDVPPMPEDEDVRRLDGVARHDRGPEPGGARGLGHDVDQGVPSEAARTGDRSERAVRDEGGHVFGKIPTVLFPNEALAFHEGTAKGREVVWERVFDSCWCEIRSEPNHMFMAFFTSPSSM